MAHEICRDSRRLRLPSAVCSADPWFERGGRYIFRGRELGQAHMYCKGMFLLHMEQNVNVIVIDNTNLKTQHYMWYVDKAREWRYEPLVVEFQTPDYSDDTCIEVVTRSRRVIDAEEFNPAERMWTFESYGDAITLEIQGLQGPNGNAEDAARAYETHLRGYGYR